MATAIPGFPAAAVREGLRIPMRMGLPLSTTEWPEFVTVVAPEPSAGTDEDGYAWDPDAVVPAPATRSARVHCAIETGGTQVQHENFGSRQPRSLKLTILDEEWAQVAGFTYVNMWPSPGAEPVRYYFRQILDRVALDVVEVYTVEVATEDAA